MQVALVTGASGFIGSNLVCHLLREGWQVHAVMRQGSSMPVLVESQLAGFKEHVYDGTTERMVKIVADANPDVVFHLASLFVAEHELKDIEPLIMANVLFGSQLLEAMRINGVSKIVNTGTSWQHYDNEDFNPVCLYASTKQAFQDILTYYTEAASINAVTLQLSDTYGPNDPRPKIFNVLAKAVANKQTLDMSLGEQLIDLVYVDDVIAAFLSAKLIIDRLEGHFVYAVSSGKPITLRELVSFYEKTAGVNLSINWGARPYRTREVMNPWSRGNVLDGWYPRVTLTDGIKRLLGFKE